MKKIILALVLLLCIVLIFGCNYTSIDLTYKFDKAIIELPNGTIVDGKIQSWRDYSNSDQLQVKINGVVYLVHSSDCVLISD